MKNKFFTIIKPMMRSLFTGRSINLSSGKKKKNTGTVILMVFLFAYLAVISGGLFFFLGDSLKQSGLLLLIPCLAFVSDTLLSLMTAAFSSQGYLFKSKDTDMLFALPVSQRTIMAAKFSMLFVFELIYTALIMIPAFIAYFYYAGTTAISVIGAAVCIFFAPLIPMFVGLLLAFGISFLSRGSSKKSYISIIVSVVFVVGYMIAIQNGDGLINYITSHGGNLLAAFREYYFPAALLCGAIEGNITDALWFILVNALPMVAGVFILSPKYPEIVGYMTSTNSSKKLKKAESVSSGKLHACFKKELSFYLSSSLYVMNTAVGPLLVFILLVYSAFNGGFAGFEGMLNEKMGLAPILCAAVLFSVTLMGTTCSSVSLEGNKLWIYKSVPVDVVTIFKAKLLINILINVPFVILDCILSVICFGISVVDAFALLLVLVPAVLAVSLLGLIFNLLKPKLEFTNEAMVIKQSMATFLTMITGMAITALCIVAYLVIKPTSFILFSIAICAVLLITSAFLVSSLKNWGVRKFNEL